VPQQLLHARVILDDQNATGGRHRLLACSFVPLLGLKQFVTLCVNA
jgi:hypothetical protein